MSTCSYYGNGRPKNYNEFCLIDVMDRTPYCDSVQTKCDSLARISMSLATARYMRCRIPTTSCTNWEILEATPRVTAAGHLCAASPNLVKCVSGVLGPYDPVVGCICLILTCPDTAPASTPALLGFMAETPAKPALDLPWHVLGLYILLADNTVPGYGPESDWDPKLYPYQQKGANVLFFTFIDPTDMKVPKAFKKLAASRGTGGAGAVPEDTRVIFAIGGASYSKDPWDWLETKEKAEAMAREVATWKNDGADGIDMDLETPASQAAGAGPNLIHFLRKLKALQPGFIVTQPTYGYPGEKAINDVINVNFKPDGGSAGLIDTIGIMIYEGTGALNYVNDYANATTKWEGFPIKVDIPPRNIIVGSSGGATTATVRALTTGVLAGDLRGIMVWYASVENGLKYGPNMDASGHIQSQQAFIEAMDLFNTVNGKTIETIPPCYLKVKGFEMCLGNQCQESKEDRVQLSAGASGRCTSDADCLPLNPVCSEYHYCQCKTYKRGDPACWSREGRLGSAGFKAAAGQCTSDAECRSRDPRNPICSEYHYCQCPSYKPGEKACWSAFAVGVGEEACPSHGWCISCL